MVTPYEFLNSILNSIWVGNVCPDIVRLYIKQGGDVNVRSITGSTALVEAARYGNVDCILELIQAGADANLQNFSGGTALIYASSAGHVDCVQLLLQAGADVNIKDKFGAAPLCEAARHGNIDIVRLLIQAGADVNTKDKFGYTVLMSCTNNNISTNCDCVHLLIASGTDVDAIDNKGETALLKALFNKRYDIAKTLVEAGADIYAKNNIGYRAIDYCKNKRIKAHLIEVAERYANIVSDSLKSSDIMTDFDIDR